MAQGRFSFGPFSSTKCGKIIGVRAAVPLALPLHARECRGCAQHGHASALPEGERSRVCNASFKVLDALCTTAGATHRGRTSICLYRCGTARATCTSNVCICFGPNTSSPSISMNRISVLKPTIHLLVTLCSQRSLWFRPASRPQLSCLP